MGHQMGLVTNVECWNGIWERMKWNNGRRGDGSRVGEGGSIGEWAAMDRHLVSGKVSQLQETVRTGKELRIHCHHCHFRPVFLPWLSGHSSKLQVRKKRRESKTIETLEKPKMVQHKLFGAVADIVVRPPFLITWKWISVRFALFIAVRLHRAPFSFDYFTVEH